MAYVQGDKGKYIESLMDESNIEFDKGDYEKSVVLLEKAWYELPEEKTSYSESFLIVWGILDISILIKDINRMKKWVEYIFICSPQRYDTGERELWAGKVAFETDDLQKAKEYFKIADNKSDGRCFEKKDSKYLKFYKS